MQHPFRTSIAVALAVSAALSACATSAAPPEAANPLTGAWKVTAISQSVGDSTRAVAVQPSLFLFGDGYYSMMQVTSETPRALAASLTPTDAEKLAAHDSYIANTGTFEVADSTITTHPIVARSPNFMEGGSDRYVFRVSGDTLWLRSSSADLKMRVGGQLVSTAGPASTNQLTLVRQK